MVSADNGHAVHPNYADKTDPTNRTYLNGGLVIKHSANQKYTTDAVSAAVMRCLCERAGQCCKDPAKIIAGLVEGIERKLIPCFCCIQHILRADIL